MYSYKLFLYFFFFFSSRRRHTRWNCYWSSDVCSSDLTHRVFNRGLLVLTGLLAVACRTDRVTDPSRPPATPSLLSFDKHGNWGQRGRLIDARLVRGIEIGRASCRERGMERVGTGG